MEYNRPLASLVVPTKGRYPYLFKLIDLLRSFDFGDDFELVIQDNNADNSDYLRYIESTPFYGIKYFYEPKSMTISENCDLAINHSTGDYVCFIGDDDCVTRNFMPCVKWMEKENVECVFPRKIMYFWPDYCDKGDERAAVHYEQFSKEITSYKTNEVLKNLLDVGCIWPANIPMIYHGIVKRTVLDKIWSRCGTYFPGASPDIASGVSLCMVVDKYVSFKFPIIVAGNSRSGGGGQKVIKHHALTDFSKLPHLPNNIEEIWCKRIPKVWCNPTIWSESAVEALNAWGRKDLIEKINFEYLYSYFVANYFYYRKLAYSLTNNKYKLYLNSTKTILVENFKKIIKMALRFLHLHLINTRIKVEGINDTKELCNYFEKNGYIFDENIRK